MDLGLKGKTSIVVGGSSNIGRGCAINLASCGANVVIAARKQQYSQKVVDLLNSFDAGGKAVAIATDATDMEQCQALVDKTLELYGAVDNLVISIGQSVDEGFLAHSLETIDLVIKSNYYATVYLFRAVLPVMMKQRSGNIVVISSVMGRTGVWGEAVYAGCKAAAINLSHSIAREMCKYNVRVNIVAPFLVVPDSPETSIPTSIWYNPELKDDESRKRVQEEFTKLSPMGSLATADDVGKAALYFASDVLSGHVTGNLIGTDGGIFMTR